ncbi:hypothetical protein FQA39_LY11901 [Lamprigera yunnana]|nr:hypothetical protein FQA39_LY11901 [Lamprigera yunnana]
MMLTNRGRLVKVSTSSSGKKGVTECVRTCPVTVRVGTNKGCTLMVWKSEAGQSQKFSELELVCGVIALGAEVICGRVPGLTVKQREMCKAAPDAMVAVGDGVRLAATECLYQFRHQRWNCTGISNPTSFGHVITVDEGFNLRLTRTIVIKNDTEEFTPVLNQKKSQARGLCRKVALRLKDHLP